jgi:hypothetical protein
MPSTFEPDPETLSITATYFRRNSEICVEAFAATEFNTSFLDRQPLQAVKVHRRLGDGPMMETEYVSENSVDFNLLRRL